MREEGGGGEYAVVGVPSGVLFLSFFAFLNTLLRGEGGYYVVLGVSASSPEKVREEGGGWEYT